MLTNPTTQPKQVYIYTLPLQSVEPLNTFSGIGLRLSLTFARKPHEYNYRTLYLLVLASETNARHRPIAVSVLVSAWDSISKGSCGYYCSEEAEANNLKGMVFCRSPLHRHSTQKMDLHQSSNRKETS